MIVSLSLADALSLITPGLSLFSLHNVTKPANTDVPLVTAEREAIDYCRIVIFTVRGHSLPKINVFSSLLSVSQFVSSCGGCPYVITTHDVIGQSQDIWDPSDLFRILYLGLTHQLNPPAIHALASRQLALNRQAYLWS